MVPVIFPCCPSSGSGCNPIEEDELFPPVDFLCQFNFTYCGPEALLLEGSSDPSGGTNKHTYLQGGK